MLLSITCLHAAAGMLFRLQLYLWLKSHQRISANQTTSGAEEVWHCKHLARGRVLCLFYWFSICEALHIYSSLGLHMAELRQRIRMPITSFVITSYALLQGTVTVPQHGQGNSKKSGRSPRCAPSECSQRYRLISLQFGLQACQPDLPQSLWINTPGLLQPSHSMFISCPPF